MQIDLARNETCLVHGSGLIVASTHGAQRLKKGVRHARSFNVVANIRWLNRRIPGRSVMTAPPPDAIFELTTVIELPQKLVDGFATDLRNAVLPPDVVIFGDPILRPAVAGTYLPGGVMIVGVWGKELGSDADRLATLKQSGFLPPGAPGIFHAGFFLSAALIQFQASLNWVEQKAQREKKEGVHFDDAITVKLSPAGIRTIVSGSDPEPFPFPDIDFTGTIDESLALNPPSSVGGPADEKSQMTSKVTASNADADGDLAFLSSIVDFIVGAVTGDDSGGLGLGAGLITFFGGRSIANDAVAGNTGVGGSLAAQWPAFELIGPVPLIERCTGKIRFLWDDLTVDTTGVRTTGTWQSEARKPAVEIIGEKFVTIPLLGGPLHEAIGAYTLSTTDLVMDQNTKIQWTGAEASQTNPGAAVAKFGKAGTFTITASVTDGDGFSATGSLQVTVRDILF
jgi:hypothetical protein